MKKMTKKSPHKYTEEELEFIKNHVKTHQYKDMVVLFNEKFNTNVSIQALKHQASKHKFRTGRQFNFKRGVPSFTKGLKWDDYMTKEGQKNSRKTCFQKGSIPVNTKPIGSERIGKNGYIIIKTANPSVWKSKHTYIYEQTYGPIPKSHRVIFADGNNRNFDLDNLICISNKTALIMAKQQLFYKDLPEATKVGITIAKLIERSSNLAKK